MKKLFFLLAVALPCLIFTACGDDDDDDLTPSNGETSGNQSQGGSQGSSQGAGENTGNKPATKVGNAVDLGLSVKWADMNVGASSPEGYGDKFAWGETQPKSSYSWDTYKYGSSSNSLTKYCTESYYGIVDNKTTLEPADDAATVNWGGAWRMPTREEMEELLTQCTWTWTSENGVCGYQVAGSNSQSIFLPAYNLGYYWTSSLGDDDRACYLLFNSSRLGFDFSNRNVGRSVRPVCQ